MKKYIDTTLRLWKLLKPFHKYFYWQLFFIIISQIASVLSTLNLAKIIDTTLNKNWTLLIYLLTSFLFLLIIQSVSSAIQSIRSTKISSGKIDTYIQEFSLDKILKLNAAQHIKDHSAIRLQVIDRGENSITDTLETLIFNALPLISNFAFSLVATIVYSKILGLYSFLVIVIVTVATFKFNSYFDKFRRQNRDNADNFRKIRVEAFIHLKLIKLFGMENKYIKIYLNERLKYIKYYIYMQIINSRFWISRNIFMNINRFISLCLAVYLFAHGYITIGIIYALFSWTGNIYNQLYSLNQIFGNLPQYFINIEKYFDVIDMKPEFEEEGKNKFLQGDIEFNNINFKYPKGENDVLHDLSFKIKEGSKVAFVGYSGSGKTTIVQLLLRAYDYSNGVIKIGNIELKDMSANSLREHIGYVEQQVDLFDDSIKNNILFGVKDLNNLIIKDDKKYSRSKRKVKITENEIEKVIEEIAKKSRIDQFYHRLGEKKFETMIGERGIKLSGGERQRVGIARALIKNPSILIFDEATSALDAENEKCIKEAIDEASLGRTTIIIAHRLSTVKDVDEIFMMSNGRILAKGKHEDLLKNSKEYRELVEAQMS